MDKLISSIHEDLKKLSEKYYWLADYNDKCLSDGKTIFFMPKLNVKNTPQPQQPDQIYIGYEHINIEKTFKYSNEFEKDEICHFPSLMSRVYANILIRGDNNSELKKQIRQCIINRCQMLQQELKRE